MLSQVIEGCQFGLEETRPHLASSYALPHMSKFYYSCKSCSADDEDEDGRRTTDDDVVVLVWSTACTGKRLPLIFIFYGFKSAHFCRKGKKGEANKGGFN